MGLSYGTCKNQRDKVRVRVVRSEHMNVRVHKNRVMSRCSGQRRDVPEVGNSDVTMLERHDIKIQRRDVPESGSKPFFQRRDVPESGSKPFFQRHDVTERVAQLLMKTFLS